MPESRLPIVFASVPHTERELISAVPQAWEAWRSIAPELQPTSIAVAVRDNELRYSFPAAEFDQAVDALSAITEAVGLPGSLAIEEPGKDTCAGRNDCHSPFESGIKIYKDTATSAYHCTMGFHVTVGGDEQFLTAGHCGFSGANDWHHPGFPGTFVGNEIAGGNLYAEDGMDIMRVALLDSQASPYLFTEPNSLEVAATRLPITNEYICASMGTSSSPVKRCGIVQDAVDTWNSETGDYVVNGADSSIASLKGDSGSPIYAVTTYPYTFATAIGIMDHEGGFFARVPDALDIWNAQIYNP